MDLTSHVRALYRQQRGEALDAGDRAALAAFDSSTTQHKGVAGSERVPADDDFNRYVALHKTQTVNFGTLGRLLKTMSKVLGEAVRGLRADTAELKAVVAGLQTKIENQKGAEAPIDSVDMGVWASGTLYPAGALVSWNGNTYVAQRETRSEPASGSGNWRLSARRGKQGRDGKPGKDADPALIKAIVLETLRELGHVQ
jgi:hypothetical protein